MPQRNLVLAALLALSLLLVMGALDHQPNSSSRAAGVSFSAQPISLAANLEKLGAGELLARAAARLAPEKTPWLIVTTWQRQTDEHGSFEAEGRLVRGPNQCARLEIKLQGSAGPATIVTVSDGVALARACRAAGKPVVVAADNFLTPAKKSPEEVEKILNLNGCGGPHFLLNDLRRVLENLHAVRGRWRGKPVIRLTGSVKQQIANAGANAPAPCPRACQLYLDAQTLWPHRVEWWAALPCESANCPILEIEFRDPKINQALSHDDCAREFTYQPGP